MHINKPRRQNSWVYFGSGGEVGHAPPDEFKFKFKFGGRDREHFFRPLAAAPALFGRRGGEQKCVPTGFAQASVDLIVERATRHPLCNQWFIDGDVDYAAVSKRGDVNGS